MKKLITLFAVLAMVSSTTFAQRGDKLKEKDLIGAWDLVFDLDALEEEVDKEIDGEHWLAEAIASSASTFAFEILDDLEIQFEFLRDNELIVTVDAYGEHEVKDGNWWIRDNALFIDTDHDKVSMDNDRFLYKNGKLIAYDKEGGDWEMQPVYLVRKD